MSAYQRLPPISRTPSPPAHILRRLRAFGGALHPIDEAPVGLSQPPVSSSSLSSAPSPPPLKKRKAKKRFLSLNKDPSGKWKKRRQQRVDREIEKALLREGSTRSNAGTANDDDDDMLESIHVAGGVLTIGTGSTNTQSRKRKRPATKRDHTSSAGAKAQQQQQQKQKQKQKQQQQQQQQEEQCDNDGGGAGNASSASSSLSDPDTDDDDDSIFTTPPPPQPAELLKLPAEPPPIYHVYRFPELTPTLSTRAPNFSDRVLLNWTRPLASQAELDAAGPGVHELALSDPMLSEHERLHWYACVKEQKDGGRKRGYEELVEKLSASPGNRWRNGVGEVTTFAGGWAVTKKEKLMDDREKLAEVGEKLAEMKKKSAEVEETSAELEEEPAEVGGGSTKLDDKSAEVEEKSAEVEEKSAEVIEKSAETEEGGNENKNESESESEKAVQANDTAVETKDTAAQTKDTAVQMKDTTVLADAKAEVEVEVEAMPDASVYETQSVQPASPEAGNITPADAMQCEQELHELQDGAVSEGDNHEKEKEKEKLQDSAPPSESEENQEKLPVEASIVDPTVEGKDDDTTPHVVAGAGSMEIAIVHKPTSPEVPEPDTDTVMEEVTTPVGVSDPIDTVDEVNGNVTPALHFFPPLVHIPLLLQAPPQPSLPELVLALALAQLAPLPIQASSSQALEPAQSAPPTVQVQSPSPQSPSLAQSTSPPVQEPDLPVQTLDLPVQTLDLPAQEPDLPVRAPDMPVQTLDLPVQAPSPHALEPAQSTPLPVQEPALLIQALDQPVQAPDMSVQTLDLPVREPDLPAQAPALPIQAPGQPVQAPDMSVQTIDLPVREPDLPVQIIDLPVREPDLPAQSPDVPVRTPGLPVQTPSPQAIKPAQPTPQLVQELDLPIQALTPPIPTLALFRESIQPQTQPQPPQLLPPTITPTSKDPPHENCSKAAATVAENDNSVETRIDNYQRTAQGENDALRVVAEGKLGTTTQASLEPMDIDVAEMDTDVADAAGVTDVTDVADVAAVSGLAVPDEEPRSSYTAPTPRSISPSISAGTEISAHLRQRSAETVEAAVTLNAVAGAAEPTAATRSQPSEDDGQSQSIEIMHGADLLLWAASAVDPSFAPHTTPGMNTTQQQYKIAQTAVAAADPKKQKQPKRPKEPKPPKPKQRRKSLIVVLKIPSTTPSVGGEVSSTEASLSPCTPSRPVPGPKFTPVNVPIPRPQPYRKPESSVPRLLPPKAGMFKSRASAVDALAAARKQTEQTRSVKSKVVSGGTASNNTPSPGGGANPLNHTTPSPAASPAMSQVSTPSQVIPRPAYAKPRPMNGGPGSTGTRDPSINRWFNVVESPPATSRSSFFPAYLIGKGFFSRNGALNEAGGSPPAQESNMAASNAEEDSTAGTKNGSSAVDAPFLGVPRAAGTPEYIEAKKIAPLVSKNNFLYWEPSMSVDVKPLISSGSPTGTLGFPSLMDGKRSYYSPPPLQPLSDIARPTTAPPPLSPLFMTLLQSPSPAQPQTPPRPAAASTSGPQRPVNPLDMVFNFSRYQRPEKKMIVLGRDILASSAKPLGPPQSPSSTRNVFEWDKLVALLETGLQFDDFRESLIVNYHHMADDEAGFNEGLQWYKRNNEVVIAKVDSVGKPPAGLVDRMKRERRALRERAEA